MHVYLPVVSTVVAFAAAVGGAFWWPRRRDALAAGAGVAAVVSIVVTVWYPGPGDNVLAGWLLVETVAQLWVVAQAVRRPPRWVALGVGVVLVGAIGVSPLRIGRWLEPPVAAVETVAVCACWTLAALAAAGVGGYLRWLDRERARSVARARREQRVQLARDLHDWLAHEMTGIVLAAQAGRLDPADASRTFRQIEEAGVRGLDAMDRALRLLRDATEHGGGSERPPTIDDVAEVVQRFSASTPATVDVAIGDGLDTLRPEVVATVHRVVVESLTNVRRHAASATGVRVEVVCRGQRVAIVVRDNGKRAVARTRRGGTGLAGLAARVEALGGTLSAGPAEPGWAVRVEVPA